MTKVKIKFRPSNNVGCRGMIVYVISHAGVKRSIVTDYMLYSHEWDRTRRMIVPLRTPARKEECAMLTKRMKWDCATLDAIVKELDEAKFEYTPDDVIGEYYRRKEEQSFFNFMDDIIYRLKKMGYATTARNYVCAFKSFSKFCGKRDMLLYEFSGDIVEEYQAWLSSRGMCLNTISFYMRILRATYNRSVEQALVVDTKPFAKAFTRNEKTTKRAISLDDMRRIKNLDLSKLPKLELARDIFLFLFYCRGMSFIDAATLTTKNVVGNEIVYRRNKTKQQLSIGVNIHIRGLIKRFRRRESEFILPILSENGRDPRMQYEAALRRINNGLKKIGLLARLSLPLTTYVSRHSWASIAKSKGIPTSIISDALGHDSEKTTQIYLASISNPAVDAANDIIIASLWEKVK